MRVGGTIFLLQLTLTLPSFAFAHGDEWMHPHLHEGLKKRSIDRPKQENTAAYWNANAQDALKRRLARKINENVAKNVILFLGDGMSIPTISAARIYIGGEEKNLSFEDFPYTGLSKTYCTDQQVPDSACSATAYLGGVKGNLGTIGVTGKVQRGDCPTMVDSTNHVPSIAHYFQQRNKKAGLVTTARVTHASPAGLFAHTAERDWESDTDIINANYDPVACPDIAHQLIYEKTGSQLSVILGGGRENFLPQSVRDQQGFPGRRTNNASLVSEWLAQKSKLGYNPRFVWNKEELQQVDFENTDYLLGLFNSDHMSFNLKRDPKLEPSLEEMTIAAIKILQRSPTGYFLFVEGARIDMAHHYAQARIALEETKEFSKAVQAAVDLTKDSDTLIVVTSDHAHTMSHGGYTRRGDDVLGIAGNADDSLPYTVLNYANGPGYKRDDGRRHDVSNDDLSDMDYKYPGIAPLASETHGGDDVAIFAKGPWAHLFTGTMEENVLPHLIAYAACVGKGATACEDEKKEWYTVR